jgi:putative PIN family toxin of toxin-antitoxin system
MQAVFDTNFWIQVFISKRNVALFDAIYTNEFDVITCDVQEKELKSALYSRSIYKRKLFPPFEDYIKIYKEYSTTIEIRYRGGLIHDYKDTYIWNLCTQGKAELLVTNDADFNILKTFKKPPIKVITAAQFWSYYKV